MSSRTIYARLTVAKCILHYIIIIVLYLYCDADDDVLATTGRNIFIVLKTRYRYSTSRDFDKTLSFHFTWLLSRYYYDVDRTTTTSQ